MESQLTFTRVPLPRLDLTLHPGRAKELLISGISQWISSEPLAALTDAWGAAVPATDLAGQLQWFDVFSAAHWDFRRGRERNLVADVDLAAERYALVLDAADALGLVYANQPSRKKYDACLILGGLVRACIVRPRYAARLQQQGVELGSVVGLGGFRQLAGDELPLVSQLGLPSITNELQAMVEGVSRSFQAYEPRHLENPNAATGNADWQVITFDGRPDLSVIAAPSENPEQRRANTADTYRWWARRQKGVQRGRILVITTSIYVPYQGSAAMQVLGLEFGADVETIGVPPAVADLGPYSQVFMPHNYLQEIRSAISGYRTLLDKVNG